MNKKQKEMKIKILKNIQIIITFAILFLFLLMFVIPINTNGDNWTAVNLNSYCNNFNTTSDVNSPCGKAKMIVWTSAFLGLLAILGYIEVNKEIKRLNKK